MNQGTDDFANIENLNFLLSMAHRATRQNQKQTT